MKKCTETENIESFLKLEASEMYGLLKHYEDLTFSLFRYYLASLVAIVSIIVTISEKLGFNSTFFGIRVIPILHIALIISGFFTFTSHLWLQVRIIRVLRQLNSIRSYFTNKYTDIARISLYPIKSLSPSFIEIRNPFQLLVVVLINGFCLSVFFKNIIFLWGIIFTLFQIVIILFVLFWLQMRSKKYQILNHDIIYGYKKKEDI